MESMSKITTKNIKREKKNHVIYSILIIGKKKKRKPNQYKFKVNLYTPTLLNFLYTYSIKLSYEATCLNKLNNI